MYVSMFFSLSRSLSLVLSLSFSFSLLLKIQHITSEPSLLSLRDRKRGQGRSRALSFVSTSCLILSQDIVSTPLVRESVLRRVRFSADKASTTHTHTERENVHTGGAGAGEGEREIERKD